MYMHSTSVVSLYRIWKDGSIKPYPVREGDSKCPYPEVIFAFQDSILTVYPIHISLPEDIKHEKGYYIRYPNSDEPWDDRVKMEEVYFLEEIPLDRCEIFAEIPVRDIQKLRSKITEIPSTELYGSLWEKFGSFCKDRVQYKPNLWYDMSPRREFVESKEVIT